MKRALLAFSLFLSLTAVAGSWFFIGTNGGGSPSTIVLDNFVDTNGMLLSAHTPDLSPLGGLGNHLWNKAGSDTLQIQSNTLVGGTGIDPYYMIDTLVSDATVTLTVNLDLTDSQVDIYARATATGAGADRMIMVNQPGSANYFFYQGGTISPPGLVANTYTSGLQVWKLVISGTTASFYIDGTLKNTATIAAATGDGTWFGIELYHPASVPQSVVTQFKVTVP